MKNFIEDYINDKVSSLDDIHDYIDEWHNSNIDCELREYLGMTKEEYSEWIKSSDSEKVLRNIINNHTI